MRKEYKTERGRENCENERDFLHERPGKKIPPFPNIETDHALTCYLTRRNNFVSGHQSGNEKRHLTETINILTSDLALEAMDRKQVTALVLLDLSKAFDSIDKSFLWAMERKVRTEERKQSKGETVKSSEALISLALWKMTL